MKPPHAEFVKIKHCPCCQSKHSKKNAGHSRSGSKMARTKVKVRLKKGYYEYGISNR